MVGGRGSAGGSNHFQRIERSDDDEDDDDDDDDDDYDDVDYRVQVVPIIVNGSIDQTEYFREVNTIFIVVMIMMIMIMMILIKILILLIQMFTSLNGLMIPGGPDNSILPDAGTICSVISSLRTLKECLKTCVGPSSLSCTKKRVYAPSFLCHHLLLAF